LRPWQAVRVQVLIARANDVIAVGGVPPDSATRPATVVDRPRYWRRVCYYNIRLVSDPCSDSLSSTRCQPDQRRYCTLL